MRRSRFTAAILPLVLTVVAPDAHSDVKEELTQQLQKAVVWGADKLEGTVVKALRFVQSKCEDGSDVASEALLRPLVDAVPAEWLGGAARKLVTLAATCGQEALKGFLCGIP